MSRRRNRHDNALVESFFQLLKRGRIRRRTYSVRADARLDVFEYIEMFYYPKRAHTNNGMLSPLDSKIRQHSLNEAVVWETRGTSVADWLAWQATADNEPEQVSRPVPNERGNAHNALRFRQRSA
jgi:hypothetical protein